MAEGFISHIIPVCLRSCENGGDPNALCTACDCTTNWDGPTCEECTIENCVTCSGSPAACDECEDDYSVDIATGLCGEYSYVFLSPGIER